MKQKNFVAIMKKELKRFFGDKRLLMSTVIMPGLMIYIIYTIMGQVMTDAFTPDEDYQPMIYAYQMPESVSAIMKQLDLTYTDITNEEQAEEKEKIKDQDADLVMTFSDDFDASVASFTTGSTDTEAPQIGLYYNSTKTESEAVYQTVSQTLDQYESALANKFDLNGGDETYDLATKEDTSAQMFSMIVPMLLIMMLFSGCMSIAPDAIAGEKERGTMATLLVTPVRRSEIAIGKIISLSIIAVLSGLSSFLGVMLSLPKLMGEQADQMSAAVYSAGDYVMLLLVVLSTVLVVIVIFSIISTYAKSVKEAASVSSPLMIVGMVVAVTASMGSTASASLPMYFIPIYNSAQCMNGIFSMGYTTSQVIATFVSNIVVAAIGIFVMTKMFDNEKIMFSK